MRIIKDRETGRSMLEVLAVIGIVALLTMGGLTGYSYLVQSHNRQETISQVNQLVLALKTSGVTRKYAANEKIPVREVIQGPKTENNGLVMLLPDGEDSHAMVTSLEGDAFALGLKVDAGTCAKLLDSFIGSGAFVHLTGSKYASVDRLSDEEREQVIQNCMDGSQSTGDFIYRCPEGSNSYRYFYNNTCNYCPEGETEDRLGECCPETGRCGGVCSCEKEGKVCDRDKDLCVLCTQDSQCWPKYEYAFSKHVCNETECIECKNDNDCRIDGGAIGLRGQNRDARYCEGQHCVECRINHQSTYTEGMCPTRAKPKCMNGTCEPCPEGSIWDDERGVCRCPEGLISHGGVCVYCYDSTPGNGRDEGCSEETPICVEQETTRVTVNGGSVEASGACKACEEDSHCPTGVPNWYCENKACEQCPEDRPYVKVNADGTHTCYHCVDDKTGDFLDSGCANDKTAENVLKRLCKPEIEGTPYKYGNVCYVCLNDKIGNANGNRDTGCEDAAKLCDAAENGYGNKCHLCQNDRPDAPNSVDSGCAAGSPLCINKDADDVRIAYNVFGTGCTKCVNDQPGNGIDTGCTAEEPMCGAATNKAGVKCSACPDGQIWNEKLAACNGAGDVNTCCAVCYDSDVNTNKDAGCGEGANAGKPICLTPGRKNDGTGTNGTACHECLVDANCPTEKPVCNQQTYTCEPCPSGTLYHNGECTVCYDNVRANGQDAGCGTGRFAGKPVCMKGSDTSFIEGGTNKNGDNCVECMNDGHCPSNKPYCVNYTCVACGDGHCIDSNNECIPLTKYDDIKRGANGQCECLAAVKTQTVDDAKNSYNGGEELEKNYNCDRLTTTRKRLYSIPVNFYCERYMHVSDGATADDYVYSSNPSGIGSSSKHDSWGEAHDNSISPRVSDGKIRNGTAKLVVSDRWAEEVGLKGYFYFTLTKSAGASGAVQKLTAQASWNSGSSQGGNTSGYRCKVGEGSSAKKKATGDAHCCQ